MGCPLDDSVNLSQTHGTIPDVQILPAMTHPGRNYGGNAVNEKVEWLAAHLATCEAAVVDSPVPDLAEEIIKAPPAPPPTSRQGRTIVNIGKRPGRNSRCACGSGKKTKFCHRNAVL